MFLKKMLLKKMLLKKMFPKKFLLKLCLKNTIISLMFNKVLFNINKDLYKHTTNALLT